jgi:hypothetical protein
MVPEEDSGLSLSPFDSQFISSFYAALNNLAVVTALFQKLAFI